MKPEPLTWSASVRIIPSGLPPQDPFASIAEPRDWDTLHTLEAMTHPGLRETGGTGACIPPQEQASDPDSDFIMAPFTHLNPTGSRFSTGYFGIYYCAKDLETALAETMHHQAQRLRETCEQPQQLHMRIIQADLSASLIHLFLPKDQTLLDPDDYTASQHFGYEARIQGHDGIRYPSVRNPGGECAAVFQPRLLRNCVSSRHIAYHWTGNEILRSSIRQSLASIQVRKV